jgi:glycolate oxidase iron-sulfur subunit
MTGDTGNPNRSDVLERVRAGFLDETRSLACIHCGLCLGSCPTYLETGNENDSPRGRIYLMRTLTSGRFGLNERTVGHLDSCLGCLACEAACPSGVEYRVLLEETREHIERRYRRGLVASFLRRVAIEGVLPYARRLRWAMAPARWLFRAGLGGWLPVWMRETVSLACRPGACDTSEGTHPATGRKGRGRVGFLTGCVMSVVFGPTNRATIGLLNQAGCEVTVPSSQGCCGALHLHGGRLEEARAFARRNIAAFEPGRWDAIVVNAAGCGSALKEYGHLLKDDPEWADRAASFAARVKDLSEFLAGLDSFRSMLAGLDRAKGPVAFHDACHLAHAQRIAREPRELVRAVAGDRLVPMPESDVCCGGAGSYFLTEPAMSARLQDRKIGNILLCGAATVVTTNPGCLIQIQAGLRKQGVTGVRIVHVADFLWERMGRADVEGRMSKGECGRANDEGGTAKDEHRTSNIEHRTSNIEHRTSNIEHRTANIERRTANGERRTANGERGRDGRGEGRGGG